jgi:LPXTG-site transpeptidase (sortase) family protein
MSEDLPTKKLPDASPEVAKMLGYNTAADSHPTPSPAKGDLPVADLPVETRHSEDHSEKKSAKARGREDETAGEKPQSKPGVKILKGIAPYAVVFIVGLFLYYFFFTTVNFGSLFSTSNQVVSTPKETALITLENQNLASYQTWIKGFYYEVTDPKIIDPNTDNSGNGLSNFQKYLLNLNPKSYDTLGLGMADSQALAQGINPLTGNQLTQAQKDVVDKYIDLEVVMNRLALSSMQHPEEQVAGTYTVNNNGVSTSPVPAPTPTAPAYVAPKTGADLNTATDESVDINTDIAGRLEIPGLKINVPIIWSKDTNSFDKDLQSGVIHYPGTALPGQIGTTYIAGHSSNYIWAKGSYNQVFSTLGNLADNTSFKITVVQRNGQNAIFHYVVTSRNQYLPTDQAQFQNTGKSLVALSTCWPVNSTARRLVVFGELTQVEK